MTSSTSITQLPTRRRASHFLDERLPAQTWPEDARFESLLRASRAFGGLAREHEVMLRLAGRRFDPDRQLADWKAQGQGIHFRWNADEWWPLFQFDSSMGLRFDVARIVAELHPVFDSWALAEWFVEPNRWTEGRPPLDLIESDWSCVTQAARGDRFLVAG